MTRLPGSAASRVPFGPESALEDGLLRLLEAVSSGEVWGLGAVLAAVGIGAVHALAPGHGKALVGAYLVGARGRSRDAVALGVLVAAMHTLSVLAVAAVLTVSARAAPAPGLDRGLRAVAATAVLGLGVVMLLRLRRTHAGVAGTDHVHLDPEVTGVAPLSRAGVVAIATTGGLVPSPAAVVLLLAALALGRPGLGALLVLAFGAGLAVTLAGIGLAVLRGRVALERAQRQRPVLRRVLAALPVLSAVAVTLGGAVLLVGAVLG